MDGILRCTDAQAGGLLIMPSTTMSFDQGAARDLLVLSLGHAREAYNVATLRVEAELQLEVEQAKAAAGLLLAVGFSFVCPAAAQGVRLMMNRLTSYNLPNTLYAAAIRVDGQASHIVNAAAEWAKSSGPGLLASATSMSHFFSELRRNFAVKTTDIYYANANQPIEVLFGVAYRFNSAVVNLEMQYMEELRVVAHAYRVLVLAIQDTTWNLFEGDVNLGRFMQGGSSVWGIFSRTHNNLALDSLSLYENTALVSDAYMFRLALARSYQEHGGPWSMGSLPGSSAYSRRMSEDALLRSQYTNPALSAVR